MMNYQFDILRREHADAEPWHQIIAFETEDANETVATALQKIGTGHSRDVAGREVAPIAWEAGCLQKKCGACAMLINGLPRLACDTFLRQLKSKKITLAPLRKFPVIRDLVTDRSVMFENLKTLEVWSETTSPVKEKDLDRAYDASRCLQCGCCLEACPNFEPGGSFFSAAGFAPQARLLTSCASSMQDNIRKLYQLHIYDGCGKALACEKVCPAGINLDRLLSRSNAVKIWHRK
ncbi:MAG: 4Fe-4S dicluster domain-containing protein [Parasporobacterium sp.]|nr:4Fe-4S dicluster domain-containing protein [Parasporobacterium sp.]